ncbi:branched-chain alpha-ketoacid dehydrogenase [Dimargaris cristalligena]|uniref:Protein-serine/threonine kinase n=1 Tax=Dimargaris cristalligena TaxID=215637 RepID=A0A4P9ZN23_9FUNG|nr:branched-chain alpha-ketoacid dehydrogenase [Dimargaris cristalligena]|eukprot:RKP34707.1 branched-chain alpha-ketoacid dehydrogenase [Dimargaris cristalligena]
MLSGRRWNHPQFYQNRVLDHYLSQPVKKITLRQLVVFGRHVTEERLLLSANYIRSELPVRLARRIRDFQHLPFIVGTNPYLEQVYDLYWEAFEFFRRLPPIDSLELNHRFTDQLREKLNDHLVIIPKLAVGINECVDHMSPAAIDRFMNVVLRSRISRRTLAEQHIALTNHYELVNGFDSPFATDYDSERSNTLSPESSPAVGIVHTDCNALNIVERCGAQCRSVFRMVYRTRHTPEVLVDGAFSARFTYIPDHIEYILYEIIKNAMRAVMERPTHHNLARPSVKSDNQTASAPPTNPYPPIHVTICEGPTTLVFRVSDQGGGIPEHAWQHIWAYGHGKRQQFSNFHQVSQMAAKVTDAIGRESPLLHFGIGLPMSRVYANYWGGRIEIHTMDEFGTDVYVHIPKLGNQHEQIEFAENNGHYEEDMGPESLLTPANGPRKFGTIQAAAPMVPGSATATASN